MLKTECQAGKYKKLYSDLLQAKKTEPLTTPGLPSYRTSVLHLQSPIMGGEGEDTQRERRTQRVECRGPAYHWQELPQVTFLS